MSNNLGLNWASLLALLVALMAVFVAFWRAKRSPALLVSREQALERRVAELENTVATLQNLLYEKTQQNGKLLAEIATLNDRVRELERAAQTDAPAVPAARPAHPQTLLAVIGEDPKLKIDLAALREVERSGNFRLSRLDGSTKADLKRTLDRYRSNRRPIRYVHMAVHAGPGGMMLAGELVTGAWLSENLKNVEVLVINGCQSTDIGDQIGIVPAVVTMREDLAHEDAAQFARLFWMGIGEGMAPAAAFEDALRLSPQGVAEFAEMA